MSERIDGYTLYDLRRGVAKFFGMAPCNVIMHVGDNVYPLHVGEDASVLDNARSCDNPLVLTVRGHGCTVEIYDDEPCCKLSSKWGEEEYYFDSKAMMEQYGNRCPIARWCDNGWTATGHNLHDLAGCDEHILVDPTWTLAKIR